MDNQKPSQFTTRTQWPDLIRKFRDLPDRVEPDPNIEQAQETLPEKPPEFNPMLLRIPVQESFIRKYQMDKLANATGILRYNNPMRQLVAINQTTGALFLSVNHQLDATGSDADFKVPSNRFIVCPPIAFMEVFYLITAPQGGFFQPIVFAYSSECDLLAPGMYAAN